MFQGFSPTGSEKYAIERTFNFRQFLIVFFFPTAVRAPEAAVINNHVITVYRVTVWKHRVKGACL